MATAKNITVSLVLGSGGARGLAHIGVIHELKKRNYEIRSISGCSMGALIGGVYAAGKLDDFEHWVSAITRLDIVSLLDLSWGKDGLVKGDRIINRLVDIVGDITIEALPISYTAIAADVANEKEVWINSGRLFDAIRASISLPLFFTPVEYKQGYLIDGGVLNPVPIAPTFNDDTDITIAVNLGGAVGFADKKVTSSKESASEPSPLQTRISQFIDEMKQSVKSNVNKSWAAYDIADQAFDAGDYRQTKTRSLSSRHND